MKGYLFHKGRLKVVISKVYTPSGSGEMQPMSQSHFVEISCVALAGQVNYIFSSFFFIFQNSFLKFLKLLFELTIKKEAVAEEVKKFGDLLRPYVRMEKLNQIMEQTNSF